MSGSCHSWGSAKAAYLEIKVALGGLVSILLFFICCRSAPLWSLALPAAHLSLSFWQGCIIRVSRQSMLLFQKRALLVAGYVI